MLVGTAFTAMAALLSLHGLATPGVILGFNGLVALSGGVTLPVGAAVLALSALPGLLDTRILAVCDALVSTRVYRAAWSAEKALGLLYEQAGAAFDSRCIEALVRVLGREAASPFRAAV